MWGVPAAKPERAVAPTVPTTPTPAPARAVEPPPNIIVDAGLSSDLSVDVAMEEESFRIAADKPSAPDVARASASARFDISEFESIRTSSLSDLAQGNLSSAPVGEIEIEADGSPSDQLELAPANDFVPGAARSEQPASRTAPTVRMAAPPPPAAVDGGEAALRTALSQASREVIEKIAWEVVPQLAEVIIREHVERLARERSPK